MCPTAKLVVVEPPLDREDVMTIMGSLFDLNGKADEIIRILTGEDDEEEETDSA